MYKLFFNIIGCLLTITGIIFMIGYLNMLDVGYSFLEYLHFMIKHGELFTLLLGIMILVFNNLGGNK